jgi:hypothetical protein
LEIVDSAKCLGVTIHKTINWNTHIENITKTLDQSLYSKKSATLSTNNKGCILSNAIKTIA